MISVTQAQRYLTGSPDQATLAVPERALGAMVTVNAVLTRVTRLGKIVEEGEAQRRRDLRNAHQLHHRAYRDQHGIARSGGGARGGPLGLFPGSGEGPGGGGEGGGATSLVGGAFGALGMRAMVGGMFRRIAASRAATSLISMARPTNLLKTGGRLIRMGGGRMIPLVGALYGGYDLYQQGKGGGNVSVLDATLTGASAGALIGSFIPVVGTAVGAAVGAGIGAVSALVYNNTGKITTAWRSMTTWVGQKTDRAIGAARSAWGGAVQGYHRLGSVVGETLHQAWRSVSGSFSDYSGQVGHWITTQADNVGNWLNGIVREMETAVGRFNLRALATQWMDHLRQWLYAKFGIGSGGRGGAGGGAGGGEAPPQGDAPTQAPGESAPAAEPVPSGRATRAPDAGLYQPGSTESAGPPPPQMPTIGQNSPAGNAMIYDGGVGFSPSGILPPAGGRQRFGWKSSPTSAIDRSGVGDGTLPAMYQQGGKSRGTETIPAMPAAPAPGAARTPPGGSLEGYGVVKSTPLAITPGRNPNLQEVDPRLLQILGAAQHHLPPGYQVQINEGFNTQGHTAGSAHHMRGIGALDTRIVDPQGHAIENRGSDPTGMYHMFARMAYGEMLARYPELKGKFSWGGAHGLGTRGGNEIPDLMHFDTFKERGHFTHNRPSNMGVWPLKNTTPVPEKGEDPATIGRNMARGVPQSQRGFVGDNYLHDSSDATSTQTPSDPSSTPHEITVHHAPIGEKAPRASTLNDAMPTMPPPPSPEKHDQPSANTSPMTKHGHASMNDIPTVHPNVHLAVSGHTDKYA